MNHIAQVFSIHNPYGCIQHDEYADLAQEPRPLAVQASQDSDHNVKSEAYSSTRVEPLTPEDVVGDLAAAMDGLAAQYPQETVAEPCEETFSFAPQAKRSLAVDIEQEHEHSKDIVVDHSHERRDTVPVRKPLGDRSNTLGSQQLQSMPKIRKLQSTGLDTYVEGEAQQL